MGQTVTRLFEDEFGANPRYSSKYGGRSSGKSNHGSGGSARAQKYQPSISSKRRSNRNHHDQSTSNVSRKAASSTSQKTQRGEHNKDRDKRRSKGGASTLSTKRSEVSSSGTLRGTRRKHANDEKKSRRASLRKGSREDQPNPKSKKTVRVTIEEDFPDPHHILSKAAPKECMVCTDTRPLNRFPARTPTTTCRHETNTCRRCLRQWIQSEMSRKGPDKINCPECGIRMEHHDIKEHASSSIFKQYDTLTTRAALSTIPNFHWCLRKSCPSGQIHSPTGSTSHKFVCQKCKYAHCTVHGVRWHKNETCAEYDYRTDARIKRAEEEASKSWMREKAKRCPNVKCGVSIEKSYGCDHMGCLKCRHEFCWVCLAPYGPIREQGNRMHKADCLHYA